MPTYIPDTLEGSSLELDGNATRRVATGIIKDIDTTTPSLVLERAHEFMQSQGKFLGQTYYTGSSTLLLKRMRFDPLSGDAVRATMVYDSETGISPAAYVITDRTFTTQYQTQRVPGTSEVLRVGATVVVDQEIDQPDGTSITAQVSQQVEPDNLTISMLRPMREIMVNALVAGNPPLTVRESVGTVNSDEWAGYPVGHWLIRSCESRYARFAGYKEVSIATISKIFEPWTEEGILINQKTGRHVPIKQDELTSALAQPYHYGVTRGNGFVVVGPYRMAPHTQVFGFSDPDNL